MRRLILRPLARIVEAWHWLAAGKSLDKFLAAHPQVDRELAVAALNDASRALVGQDSRGE